MKTKTNFLFSNFNNLNFYSRQLLFNNHCLSLYGSELYDVNDASINKLCTAWRVCCRKIGKLLQRTRSCYINSIFNTNCLFDIICQRVINFIIKGINHENESVRYIFNNSIHCLSSYFSRNFSMIRSYLNLNDDILLWNKKIKIKSVSSIETWKMNLLRELVSVVDGEITIDFDEQCLTD